MFALIKITTTSFESNAKTTTKQMTHITNKTFEEDSIVYSMSKPVAAIVMAILSFSSSSDFSSYIGRSIRLKRVL